MRLALLSIIIILGLFLQPVIVFTQAHQPRSLPETFEYPLTGERDPFYPLVQAPEKTEAKSTGKEPASPVPIIIDSEYRLLGIIWDETGSLALVAKGTNVWLIKEGMDFEGLQVARIQGEKGEVILVGENKIIQLKMFEI